MMENIQYLGYRPNSQESLPLIEYLHWGIFFSIILKFLRELLDRQDLALSVDYKLVCSR